MKNVKKMVSFILAMVMACSMTFTTAFAVDETGNESTPTRHTIEITLPPQSEDDGIMPCAWGQFTPATADNNSYTTPKFDIPDRYCAFEANASDVNGNPANGTYSVALMKNGGLVASINKDIDTITYKKDWITVNPGEHYFIITNHSNYIINFNITYYTWK